MSVSTVIILGVVVVVIAALVLAPPVVTPRASARSTGRGRRFGGTGARRRGRRRLRTVPEPRPGQYGRSTG
ncbi:hypothetical protein [Streptomyces sp. NBC_01565]|uniref:hypothetical protein n=1 Tax=unclassified Streptomyces TaxID=2593676 RepID=UPI00224CE02C|nr:hypothetical protein [Streptomyces sp. NBC_01565]MCX4545682.1 hypothetical protein [Streptomyces sp. NBC_01565]